MKIEQISKHIWSIQTWLLIPVRVWAVLEEDGITLVDAGIPSMANGILKHIERTHQAPLKRILLTHGHSDHVGSVKRIVERTAAPVFAHAKEIPYLQGDALYPRRKKLEQNIRKGLTQSLAEKEDGTLQPVGSLQPYFTPGHSPGHVVYYHAEDRVLLSGDLWTSKRGKLHRPMPMFTADLAEAVRSSQILRQISPQRVEVCHGGPVFQPADQLDEYIRTTTAAYSLPEIAKGLAL